MDSFKSYLALDLELNTPRENRSVVIPRIIQVGIAWGSWDHYADNCIHTKKWYLDPQEHIYPEITDLTGITDNDIKNYSVTHEQLARELHEIIQSNDTFINPITWGGGDSQSLLNEFRERRISFPHFGRRWIDVKTWYVFQALAKNHSTSGGLKSAVQRHGIKFVGLAHQADVDALNTLRLFFKMLDDQCKVNNLLELAKSI